MSNGKSKKRQSVSRKSKIDAVIVAAIIGLIGTIATAIFGSPVLIAWIQKSSLSANNQNSATQSIISNIASQGIVEVSSISSQADFCQNGESALDGVIGGYPDNPCNEWVASHTDPNASIKITFKQPRQISQVVLYDRVNEIENILSGTLEFSDGTKQKVEALPNNGSAKVISLVTPKIVEWLKFTIDQMDSQGTNTGLAEIEVMGSPINP